MRVAIFSSVVSAILFGVFTAELFGQIDISELYKPHDPIDVRCACAVPEGAVMRVLWDVPTGVQSREHPAGDTALYLWAKPGQHTLGMIAVFQYGEEREIVVDVIDGKPVKETIRVSTGIDVQRYSRAFTVEGVPDPKPEPGPGPGPNPDPIVPTTPMRLIVVAESSQVTTAQAKLFNEIRADLPGAVKYYTRFDPDDGATSSLAASWIALADQSQLPYFFTTDSRGRIVRHGKLPATYGLLEELCK